MTARIRPHTFPRRRARRRGFMMLGASAFLALITVLAFIVLSRVTESTRQTALLRWRLEAQHLAEGGIDTARAELAARASGGAADAGTSATLAQGTWKFAGRDSECRWSLSPGSEAGEWVAVADAVAPNTTNPGYSCRLRARFSRDANAPGGFALRSLEWATPGHDEAAHGAAKERSQ